MHIRLAQREDLPAIVAISNWAAIHTPANFAIEPESVDSWLKSFDETQARYPWLVAIEGISRNPQLPDPTQVSTKSNLEESAIIGFAKASPHKGRCAYAWTAEVSVYIHPDHHGRRIGTLLYEQLISILKAQGYITLIAGITLPNPASQNLHQAFGFKHIGTFRKVGWKFSHWHDVGYWEAVLVETAEAPPKIRTVAEAMANQQA